MKALLWLDKWLEKIAGWLLVSFLSTMIVMAFGQIVLRNFFDTSIGWGDIFLRHMVLWVGYFGAIIATGEGRHLKIEFVNKLVPPKVHKVFKVATNLFAGVICFFLTRAAVSFFQMEQESGANLILDLSSTYFIVIIPIGYALVSFRFFVQAIAALVDIIQGRWEIMEAQHL